MKPAAERAFERGLFASRWLMAPMYLGLLVALVGLIIVFLRETYEMFPAVLTMTAEEVILAVLTLIDLTLAANLLLIVLFSGYENFVSKLDLGENADRPDWMGTVDFAGLKMKLVASIVAISGIHLLKQFMEIGEETGELAQTGLGMSAMAQTELFWLTVIHLSFVISGVLMAVMDWFVARSGKKGA